MLFHENRLPADDSHEISCLICYFWKSSKIWKCRLLQILVGALRVKTNPFWRYRIVHQLTCFPIGSLSLDQTPPWSIFKGRIALISSNTVKKHSSTVWSWNKAPPIICSRRQLQILPLFQKQHIRHDISWESSAGRRFSCNILPHFCWNLWKMSQNLSSAAVVIGALRVNS